MPHFVPPSANASARVMTFIDGENLAIRFAALLGQQPAPRHVAFEKNVYVWSSWASRHRPHDYVRRYYYTSVTGDDGKQLEVEESLIAVGIEAPRVFRKQKGRRSKRVDVTLTTEMLSHAHRRNYEIAVLVAGDDDYVPLVEAVKAEGCRVALWFLDNGLSPALRRACDHYFDLGQILLVPNIDDGAFRAIFG